MKIPEIRQALTVATENLQNYLDNAEEFERHHKTVTDLQTKLGLAQRAEKAQAALALPVGEQAQGANNAGTETPPTTGAGFRNFGEQLAAVMHARQNGNPDAKLVRAPIGAGEIDPSGGGFLVQTDFANTVLTRIYDLGQIAKAVKRLPPLTGNSIKIPAVDETSRATGSRWGGVQAFWIGEGDNITASRPKFRLMNLDLKKLAAVYFASDELLQDTNLFGAIASEAFSEELQFMFEDSVWEGTGGGMPQGFMNSKALITVPKEAGQPATTLVYANILKMWSSMWARSRKDAVWYINQDVEPQLYALSQVIGTAGVPVYLPANGISGQSYGTLFGRPVVPVEYASTLGTEGDIVLADLSQYTVVEKGGIQSASSMHVQFLTDQMAFRMIYRVDGQSMWQAPLKPFKGQNAKSPFVALASRT